MDINTTEWFYDRIWKDNLCVLYNGSYGDDITDKFINLSDYSGKEGEYAKLNNKISGIIAECFQNIIRTEESTRDTGSSKNEGFFLSKNLDDVHYISTGNLIESKDVDPLKNQLININKLDKEGLKKLYRELLNNDEFSKQTMTGLGLIDMARKSGQAIEYSFKDYDELQSLFYNQVAIHHGKGKTEAYDFSLDEARLYHKKMRYENILLIHKGDFAHESILTLLNIIQRNLREKIKKSGSFRKIYHILVELIQNIGRHCIIEDGVREGIFLLGKTDDGYVINTGNFIESEKAEGFKKKLQSLENLSESELKALYRKTLVEGRLSDKGGAGIGMIDIFRTAKEPIQYKFTPFDEKKSFFTNCVVV